jgi:benzoyl-CoA reductase subunit A
VDCYIGIDLGSTTTKAVYLDADERILGRGITNSRSNYDLACHIAREEAEINARFALLRGRIEADRRVGALAPLLMEWLSCSFKLGQHLRQLEALRQVCTADVDGWTDAKARAEYRSMIDDIFSVMAREAEDVYAPGVTSRSDFFRDIAASQYMAGVERLAGDRSAVFDRLTSVFDRSILKVESQNYADDFAGQLRFASARTIARPELTGQAAEIQDAVDFAANLRFDVVNTIGTGYGRQRLPFPKHQIRSEILCHGLGAHYMFPATATVLDIGGQDTKAIQIDGRGIVTNFQMNDRCAAGCGRYLGYIADEMNMGVHELGPLAMRSTHQVKINSTCTVFAGSEIRERMAAGENREDILAGLHRAMILRAMSLLARSGGVRNEFTFTGGVARNQAAVAALKKLVQENYGDMTLNITTDSIFTGSLGAALFAKRDQNGDMANVDLTKLAKRA